jgi:sugar-specific transcriptional regulator TrmB
MSTAGYFLTDEQLKAKKWDMQEEAKELKSRLASLEHELSKFTSSWTQAGKTCTSSWSYQIGEKALEVVNPSQKCTILTVPWVHFDAETIKRLLADIQTTKDAIVEANRGLRALGINPAPYFEL